MRTVQMASKDVLMETLAAEKERAPLRARLGRLLSDRRTPWAALALGLAAFVLLRGPLLAARRFYPACAFYGTTGFWCPGCGNTRSVLCLLRGELLQSLRFNILPVLAGVLAALYFTEWVLHTRGKRLRLLPRSERFWFTVLGLWLAYCAARNFIPGLLP